MESSNVVKIESNIVSQKISRPGESSSESQDDGTSIINMNESLGRPECLEGTTYKLRDPNSGHALYITINDIVLNEKTNHEQRLPFEIFINSKNMDHFQWVVALTRVMSAVFRKGGDVSFLVEEMKAVFDPKGGYLKPGGKFCPSLIADIGSVIEKHLIRIGVISPREMDESTQEMVTQKREELGLTEDEYPPGASACSNCGEWAVVRMDGCNTCLACGDSKCG